MKLVRFIMTIFKSLLLAFSFMTRIPTGSKVLAKDDPAWKYYTIFYPLCGAAVGYICLFLVKMVTYNLYFVHLNYATSYSASNTYLFYPVMSATLFLVFYYYMTRAMHLDGFCDVADALMAVGDQEKRRAILKDSCVGVGALCSGVLLILLKIILLSMIFYLTFEWYFCGQASIFILLSLILSRTLVVLFSTFAKSIYDGNDKKNTSFSTLQLPQLRNFVVGSLLFFTPFVIYIFNSWELTPTELIILLAKYLIPQLILMAILYYKSIKAFGGVNGDVLGCFIESSEVLSLFVTVFIIHHKILSMTAG